jgi:hypothetical protein
MGTVSVRLTDGRTLHLDDQPVGSGAEKRVFLTRDRQYAVGFFFGSLRDRRERVDRLTRIIATYNPTLGAHGDYWTPYFSWPVAMAEGVNAIPMEFARGRGWCGRRSGWSRRCTAMRSTFAIASATRPRRK